MSVSEEIIRQVDHLFAGLRALPAIKLPAADFPFANVLFVSVPLVRLYDVERLLVLLKAEYEEDIRAVPD